MRPSRQIALYTYAVILLVGLVTVVLALNAGSDGQFWTLSRKLGLRPDNLRAALIPGAIVSVVGAIGLYRSILAQSSRRHRHK